MTRISDLLAQGQTFSFEFFPPKTDEAQQNLVQVIAELGPLKPSFVSVTYGAGGSTRQRTQELVSWIRRETEITPMAHLTCQGHSRQEVNSILENYAHDGIENILALGGDPPRQDNGVDQVSDYRFASELLDDVLVGGRFSAGVAAHPELHPRSPDRVTDRRYLAEKLGRADFAITQFFFEIDVYVRLCEELLALGIDKPVLPGIMPVTNKTQITTMAKMSGAAFPQWLADRLEDVDDPDEVRKIGVEAASELAQALLDVGAPGLHFYTLNRSTATREIYANLGLFGRK
ncbi:MAG: 5,10-methylenetetrahydrofolate reductase [Actinomycetota bacterium]